MSELPSFTVRSAELAAVVPAAMSWVAMSCSPICSALAELKVPRVGLAGLIGRGGRNGAEGLVLERDPVACLWRLGHPGLIQRRLQDDQPAIPDLDRALDLILRVAGDAGAQHEITREI